MRLKSKCIIVALIAVNFAFSQKSDIIMTIDGEAITTLEFLKQYYKNIEVVKEDSQKGIDNYLDLFINYKLKIKEAYRLGLNNDANYKQEFANYKNQLTKNYLSDNKVTEALVEEAHQRLQFDIRASHILILNNPKEEDTLVAYNKLLEYRSVFLTQGFDAAKKNYHDGKTVLVQDLGYFSAFKMVYDFETAAYNTQPGSVSMPFKTQFGYHIVRVEEKRPSSGTLTAAHIMVALQQEDSTLNSDIRINEIYKKLQQGEAFEALAKQFSDDKNSATSGGKLTAFKRGQIGSTVFENAAFDLKNNGDITEPIKTEFGWHIIKLIGKKTLPSFEDLKATLASQVKGDARSKLINSAMAKELSQRYNILKNPEFKSYFNTIIAADFFTDNFNFSDNFNGQTSVITVNDSVFTVTDFLTYLKSKQGQSIPEKSNQKKSLENHLELFYEQSVLKFREDNLINENEEFADIVKDYRDGLLLFELMNNEIWNKASKDSTGIETYYNAHKPLYMWENRIQTVMASTSNKNKAETLLQLIKDGKSEDEIAEVLNTKNKHNVIFTRGIFEVSNTKIPRDFELKEGISEIYDHNDAYCVLNVKAVYLSEPKTLKEAKGQVINDYQSYIETAWLKTLNARYAVKVNKKVVRKIKSKIKNQY
jgi:peptidyl-prolyl cis-trans isomerase SurA